MLLLGRMYDFGYGVKQDFEEAKRWYLKSAAFGEPLSFYDLYMTTNNIEQALAFLRTGAELDDFRCNVELGINIYSGGKSRQRNREEGI